MKVAPEKPVHTLTEAERREMLSHPSDSSLITPTVSEVNNSSERTQNARGSEDSNSHVNESNYGGNGEVLMEEDETAALFGIHRSEIEDIVRAPLASPETLSLASGVAVFSPSSSIVGRDSLRQSLQRCAVKQMDSPSENLDDNGITSNKTQQSQTTGNVSLNRGRASPRGWENGVPSSIMDIEAGRNPEIEEHDDYKGKLRSGNTISVQAEVVNEMTKQSLASSPTLEIEAALTEVSGNVIQSLDTSSAILEPSSHTHVVSPSHQRLVNCESSNPSTQSDQTSSEESSDNPAKRDIRPGTLSDVGLVDWELGGKDETDVSDGYTRHSPLESNQHEYAHPNIYYSQGGIGYPHNAFHPPLRFYSYPEDEEVDNFLDDGIENEENGNQPLINRDTYSGNVKKTIDSFTTKPAPRKPFKHAESESNLLSHRKLLPRMKRSAEQDDIVHLCDALEVFENEEDKIRLCQSTQELNEEPEDPSGFEEDATGIEFLPTFCAQSSNKHPVFFGDSDKISSSLTEDSNYVTNTSSVDNGESFSIGEQQVSSSDPESKDFSSTNQKAGQIADCPLLLNTTDQVLHDESSSDNFTKLPLDQGDSNFMQETHL